MQVTWAQHGHTQCMHKHTFATGPGAYILNYTLEIVSEAVSGDKYHSSDSPVCSLHLVVEAGVNLMKSEAVGKAD